MAVKSRNNHYQWDGIVRTWESSGRLSRSRRYVHPNSMYDTILYPTDGSQGADAALENAQHLAETYDSTVHVLYVAQEIHEALGLSSDPKEHSPGMGDGPEGSEDGMVGTRASTEEFRSQVREYGQEVVDEAASHLAGVETETAVRSGEPHQVILDYAGESDVDVIVMGTHGRTGLDRYLIGSITEKVVRLSDVPVLTVRASSE
jgi:nucleotide-binding universal stress UspA family protein